MDCSYPTSYTLTAMDNLSEWEYRHRMVDAVALSFLITFLIPYLFL